MLFKTLGRKQSGREEKKNFFWLPGGEGLTLTNNKILALSKVKAFADDKFIVAKMKTW